MAESTATERIVLGSGKLYIAEFNSAEGIPSNAELETEANRAGYIKGGATLEYKPEFYEAKDDLGYAMKKVLTEEEVIFKSGIMTWNMKKLMALCNTGRKDETDSDENVSIYKLGGIGNYDGKRYVVHFHHEDKIDGDLRVTIIGANRAGFTLSFMKNQETVADAEFKAEPYDNDGTLVILQESSPTDNPVKDDATLKDLKLSGIPFNFDPEVEAYALEAEDLADDKTTLTATLSDLEADLAVSLNGVDQSVTAVQGVATKVLTLVDTAPGLNTLAIEVENDGASKTYIVSITYTKN